MTLCGSDGVDTVFEFRWMMQVCARPASGMVDPRLLLENES